MNELDPTMLAQAQMLGGARRMPTKAEIRDAEHQGIMMAILSVAGTSFSSLLEGGYAGTFEECRGLSERVAEAILKKSEQTKEDFGEDIMKRKLRNQLGAQLTYSALRGDTTIVTADELVNRTFESATKLVRSADEFATKELENAEDTSPTLTVPS